MSVVGKAWCFRLELAAHMFFLLGCSVGQDSWKEECLRPRWNTGCWAPWEEGVRDRRLHSSAPHLLPSIHP